MSKSRIHGGLDELLTIWPRPECDMVPTTGRHTALAAVAFEVFKPGQKHQRVNVCAKHERDFITRTEAAGFTIGTLHAWR